MTNYGIIKQSEVRTGNRLSPSLAYAHFECGLALPLFYLRLTFSCVVAREWGRREVLIPPHLDTPRAIKIDPGAIQEV